MSAIHLALQPNIRINSLPLRCYWHLDTRREEHERMSSSGWIGRLKLAAPAIDARLKLDKMQTVCHGDAKGANILYAQRDGQVVPLVYDFQFVARLFARALQVTRCACTAERLAPQKTWPTSATLKRKRRMSSSCCFTTTPHS